MSNQETPTPSKCPGQESHLQGKDKCGELMVLWQQETERSLLFLTVLQCWCSTVSLPLDTFAITPPMLGLNFLQNSSVT